MYILDTNVVSELFRPRPDPNVVAWVDAQRGPDVYLTTTIEGELWAWAETQDKGKRRDRIFAEVDGIIHDYFGGRVLVYDREAARMFAIVYAERRAAGLSVNAADCQIIAIARLHGAAVVTRDLNDFTGSGIEVSDPWVAT